MTAAQVEEHRLRQANGEKAPTMKASEVPEYDINVHEKHMVHVYLEKIEWDQNSPTPKKVSLPGRIQKFYLNDFIQMSKTEMNKDEKGNAQNAFGAYSVIKVIHDPRNMNDEKKDTVAPEVNSEVNLSEKSIDELRAIYFETTGQDVDENMSPNQVIFLIEEAKGGIQ